MEIALITNASSLNVRPGRPATADIWFIINGLGFPKQPWNDFAIVVLGWWATALSRLLRNATDRELVHFMDGPYAVEVSKVDIGLLRFRGLEGLDRSKEVAVCESPAMPFILEVIAQSRKILDECRRNGWWSEDAETLETSITALELESFRFQG